MGHSPGRLPTVILSSTSVYSASSRVACESPQGHVQRRIFLLRTGSFISAFPRTVCVRWVQALQRARGQCSFSLNARNMVTRGPHSRRQAHTKCTDPTQGQPCALPEMLADWWINFPRFLSGREWGGRGSSWRNSLGWEATAQQTPPRRQFPHRPLTGSLRRHSWNHTHTEALIRQGRRVTLCAQTRTRG